MQKIYLVTGNAKKLNEWQAILPADIAMESLSIDLAEIQSEDPEEIVIDKARRAYEQTGKPVVVEDVGAGIDRFGGLPGPYIKYFVKQLGGDALYKLAGQEEPGSVSCWVAYYDGDTLFTTTATVNGMVVAPRGDDAFFFDVSFVPKGETLTYSEMGPEKKNTLSHRRKAIEQFVAKFKELSHDR